MSEEFDAGPLSWVKDEIDQSLKKVMDSYIVVAEHPEDYTSLKLSLTHLYQVNGALDMVGLEGCKRYCTEIEKLTSQVEKGLIAVNPALMEELMLSVQILSQYLQDLLNGIPDTPTRLYDSIKRLVELQGGTIEITDLFYPDTSYSLPNDLPANLIADSALPIFVAEQRSIFQKSLLEWLLSKDPQALNRMKNALFNVQKVQQKKSHKSLWWAATAFTEALSQEKVAALAGAKKLCRKLDQQLRNMSLGDTKVPSHLLRDVLYYVAISDRNSAQIARVKDVFELDSVLPSDTRAQREPLVLTDAERAALAQLISELSALKETWVRISEVHRQQNNRLPEIQTELGVVDATLRSLLDTMESIASEQLSSNGQSLASLLDVMRFVTAHMLHNPMQLNEAVILEMATAINLLEYITEHYQHVETETQQKVNAQIKRLQTIFNTSVPVDLNDEEAMLDLEDSVTVAVATQIIQALQQVEKSLDSFFRNPSLTTVLTDAEKPLNQVAAAFDMLEMPTPKTIAKLSLIYVEQFKNAMPDQTSDDVSAHPYQSQFELFADSLSLLSLYAQDLPDIRAETKYALSDCLKRLEEGVEIFGSLPEKSPLSLQTSHQDSTELALEAFSEGDIHTEELNDGFAVQTKPIQFLSIEVIDQALDAELLDIFVTEAEQVLDSAEKNIQLLRTNESDPEALIDLRRAFHTLKGSGKTVGLQAIGDVALAVEKILNIAIEYKVSPTADILSFVENTNKHFVNWITQLREQHSVTLNAGQFQQEAADLALAFENELILAKPKARKEEVLIGGSRKVGRAFFYLFLGEAQLHLNTLIEAQQAIKLMSNEMPSAASCRAAHTLSSNALTAGFETIGELARALEHWLDEFTGAWTDKHLALYQKVNQSLADGLDKAKNLQNPRSTRSLVIELSKSTAAMQVLASTNAESSLSRRKVTTKKMLEALQADESNSSDISKTPQAGIASMQLRPPAMLLRPINQLPPMQLQVSKPITQGMDAPPIVPTKQSKTLHQLPGVVPNKGEDDAQAQTNSSPATTDTDIPVDIEKPADVKSDANVNQELLNLFIEEASDLLPQIGRSLRNWKITPDAQEHADALQRALHTLKGSARTTLQHHMGDRIHELEDRIASLLKHRPSQDDFDGLLIEFDRISFMFDDLLRAPKVDQASLALKDEPIPSPASTELKSQFLRVRSSMLDRLINEAGEVSILRSRMDREMQGFKQSSLDLGLAVDRMRTYLQELEIEAETQMQSRMNVVQEANSAFDPLELDRYTRLQELTRMMVESMSDVTTIQQNLVSHVDHTDVALQQQNRINRDLQKGLMAVRMMPFASITERLYRIVRQVSRELNKRVELTVEGEAIELDRSVLDKIGAPLEHLLRNAVAHGIESTKERIVLGKAIPAKIKLKVMLENDEITLMVSDDGRGIDLAKIKETAIEKGLLTSKQTISEQALMAIIFESGFSTEENVSKIAGRGVGLDAVRTDIAALNGRIDVANMPGAGAIFNIYLPMTLSVTQVVVVRMGEQQFAIPSVMVEQVKTLKQEELAQAYDVQNVTWSEHDYPLYFLARLIGNTDYRAKSLTYTPIILLRSGQYRTALHVDEVLGNEEVVMKSMGTQLTRVPGVVGATVMGDGAIVIVINPVQLAHREALTVGAIKVTNFAAVAEQTKKIALIVDDSLTMRKVLSRILDREGFDVVTANDGLDAIQKLQEMTPDIILTDIEMPRMDGFEFSWYVRDTPRTAKVPLIIISSRTAQKHRTIAKEIGVNAFLGKPVQDEALVNMVKDLIQNPAKEFDPRMDFNVNN